MKLPNITILVIAAMLTVMLCTTLLVSLDKLPPEAFADVLKYLGTFAGGWLIKSPRQGTQ